MKKVPSVKVLLFTILFIFITSHTYSDISWALLRNQAEEYRYEAEKLQSEGKLEQAVEFYQKAIALDKYSAAVYNSLAVCYERLGRLKQAEEEYQHALEIDPKYAPTHFNLGLLYEKRGDLEQAIFHWRQRIFLGHPADPGRIKARLKLKKYAPEQLQEEEARELAQQLVQDKEEQDFEQVLGRNEYKTKEEIIQDYYLEGMLFFQKGDYRKTAELFQKMIETLPFSN